VVDINKYCCETLLKKRRLTLDLPATINNVSGMKPSISLSSKVGVKDETISMRGFIFCSVLGER